MWPMSHWAPDLPRMVALEHVQPRFGREHTDSARATTGIDRGSEATCAVVASANRGNATAVAPRRDATSQMIVGTARA